jgi:hypothetical protein
LVQGKENLGHYQFGERTIVHSFCQTCGIHPFARSSIPEMGGDFVCVNIACLDDVTTQDYAAAPIRHENGAEDDWINPPLVTSYL